jgi:hypothetical protein
MALNEGFENIKIFNFQNGENILSVTIKEIIDNINIIYTWDCALYLSCFLISHSDVKNTTIIFVQNITHFVIMSRNFAEKGLSS